MLQLKALSDKKVINAYAGIHTTLNECIDAIVSVKTYVNSHRSKCIAMYIKNSFLQHIL